MGHRAIFENSPKREFFFEDQLPGLGRKKSQAYLISAELHRLVAPIKLQDHFAKIEVVALGAPEDFQVNIGTVKLLQCRRHIILMDEQAAIRLRNLFAG